MVKESTCDAGSAGDLHLIPGLGISPGEGNGNPLLPWKSHGQGSLVDCSLRGHRVRQSEQLSAHAHMAGLSF